MKKILIFGGAGFIGLHLAKKLINEYEVHILDNFSRGIRDINIENFLTNRNTKIINIDALDHNSVSSLDNDYSYIFQLAAIVGVENVNNNPYETIYKNFLINHHALELARKQKNFEKFIFFSTSEVQSSSSNYIPMKYPTPENFPICLPDLHTKRSTYMLSKIYGEAMCIHHNVPSMILRPHNIYGPRMGMSHVIPELLVRFYNANLNESLKIYSLSHKRAFCYIDDAIDMIIGLIKNTKSENITEIFNIGNEKEEISIRDLVNVLLDTLDRNDLNILSDINTEGSPSRRCPDMNKTLSISKTSPSTDIKEGCWKTWEWYKKNL